MLDLANYILNHMEAFAWIQVKVKNKLKRKITES